jgi:carboxypeptidase T
MLRVFSAIALLCATAHADLVWYPMKKGEKPPQAFRRLKRSLGAGAEPVGADLEKRQVVLEVLPVTDTHRAARRVSQFVLDSRYRTHNEVNEYLGKVVAAYPKWVKVETLGQTAEGRDINAIRLRYPGSPDSGRKSVYFDALHHAREVATPEVVLDIVAELLEKACANNGEERAWLQAFDVWVVPMVNPDGSYRVWNGNPMQRKNGRNVDNNRNDEVDWNACNGSSDYPGDEQYHGPGPLSEKENQALKGLADRIRPVAAITYHSFSEMVLYPPGCPGRPKDPNVVALGKRIAASLVRDSGRGTYAPGTSYELLYPTDGDKTQALYGRYGTLAFTVEVSGSNAGFQPPFDGYRDDLVARQRPGWRLLLGEALRLVKGK